MGILSGFKKVKRYIKTTDGYALLSQWTSANTVEMDNGDTLEEKMISVDKNINDEITRAKEAEQTVSSNANAYTDTKIANLINGAPTTLDTLGEIADAMAENESVVEALNTAIGTKANKSDIPTKLSGLTDDLSGLTDKSLYTEVSSTTEGGWSILSSIYENNDYKSTSLLKSIRTQAKAPNWLCGNFSAGIAFGGKDTKGVISVPYDTPGIKIAGGSGSEPKWYFALTGTSGKFYALPSDGGTLALTTDNVSSATDATYLANAYSSRQASMNFNTKNMNKMFYTIASSSVTDGKPPEDACVLTFPWDNNGWAAQFAISSDSNPNAYIRGANDNNGDSNWDSAWKTLLDSGNYKTYCTPANIGALTSSSTLDATKLSGTVPSACYTNTTYNTVSTSAAGLAPKVTDTSKYLRGDGTWATPTNTTYSTANSSTLGLVKTGSAISDATGYTACPIKDGVIYYKDTNTTYTLAGLMGSSAIGSSTQPVYWTGSKWANATQTSVSGSSGSCTGNAATASKLGTSTVGGTTSPIYLDSGTATACTGRTVPGIKSASAVTDLGWGTNNSYVSDITLLAYWNGAYSGTSSNLQYCSQGKFGTIITKGSGDYLPISGGTLTGKLTTSELVLPTTASSSNYAVWITT
jgi:hypothetical protein